MTTLMHIKTLKICVLLLLMGISSCEKSDENSQSSPPDESEEVPDEDSSVVAPEMIGINGLKDTSRLLESNGKIFCYATGGGIKMIYASSLERGAWNIGPDVFTEKPTWWANYSPINIAWAPDVIWDDDSSEYRMYYCTSKLGSSTSAIGLATNKTLDPTDESYNWTDKGIVISSLENEDAYNALDPCPVKTPDGSWYLVFGSHFGGIKMISLNDEGLWDEEDSEISDLARKEDSFRNAIEAPSIYPGTKEGKNGFWLFVNWGTGNSVANNENSTYEVMMGWSENIRGPYLDKKGIDLYDGGGTVFIPNEQSFEWDGSTRIGPGHVGIIKGEKLDDSYSDWVSYSYWLKDPPATNGIRLGLQKLEKDEEGWLRVGDILKYDY